MRRVLVTAGPTREALDPVRFLSNRSSGKMGYAIARAAQMRGDAVTLISGPVALEPPAGVTVIQVESAAEMATAVKRLAGAMQLIIMAAAVADYRPGSVSAHKIKKRPGAFFLELERTEDILASLGAVKPAGQILVGFAAETDDLLANAQGKLERKNLDWIVANEVGRPDRGFAADANAVTMLARDGRRISLELAEKNLIADEILRVIG